ncbi:MAG: hypothetical protein N838_21145 [Thiohalocapsa sp. PB-PSB1]|nr:MAG: hypothetical protein N838_21145 [Thiohalocapsa sp. PB-PSB1]
MREAHRDTRDKRRADHTKAVVLLASGWRAKDVAGAPLIDANSVRNHFRLMLAAIRYFFTILQRLPIT